MVRAAPVASRTNPSIRASKGHWTTTVSPEPSSVYVVLALFYSSCLSSPYFSCQDYPRSPIESLDLVYTAPAPHRNGMSVLSKPTRITSAPLTFSATRQTHPSSALRWPSANFSRPLSPTELSPLTTKIPSMLLSTVSPSPSRSTLPTRPP